MSSSPVPSTLAPQKGAPAAAAAARPKTLRWEAAWGSDPGMVRTLNEDAIRGTPPGEPAVPVAARGHLFIVADGMGGHNAGEIASNQSVLRIYKRYYDDADPDISHSLERIVRQTNNELYREAQITPGQQGMGTTLTAAVIKDNQLYVVHVGDSRLYLIRNGQPEQVTHDDSWVEEQVRAGVLTRLQAETHPQRNVITRALATAADVQVAKSQRDLQPGDVIVMCSDGLNTEVGDHQIASHATKSNTPTEAVARLIQLAKDNGGEDNVSVAVIRFGGEAAAVAAPVAVKPAPGGAVVAPAGAVAAAGAAQTAKPKRRSRIVPIVAALALVLVVGSAAGLYLLNPWAARPVPPTSPIIATAAPVAAGEPTSTLSATGIETRPTATPAAPGQASATSAPAITPTGAGGPIEPTSTLAPGVTRVLPTATPTVATTRGTAPTPIAGQHGRPLPPPVPQQPNGSDQPGPQIVFNWLPGAHALSSTEGYAVLVWSPDKQGEGGDLDLNLPSPGDFCKERWAGTQYSMPAETLQQPTWGGVGSFRWTVVIVDTSQKDANGRCTVVSQKGDVLTFGYAPTGGGQCPRTACPPRTSWDQASCSCK